MRSLRLPVALLALWLLGAGPAWADDCSKPLKMLASLPMTPIGSDGRVSVDILVNDTKQGFLLDTGGMFLMASSTLVDELKLPRLSSNYELFAADGTVSRDAARADSIQIGNLRAAHVEMQIAPRISISFRPSSFPLMISRWTLPPAS